MTNKLPEVGKKYYWKHSFNNFSLVLGFIKDGIILVNDRDISEDVEETIKSATLCSISGFWSSHKPLKDNSQPNEETLKSFSDYEQKKDLTACANVEELFSNLKSSSKKFPEMNDKEKLEAILLTHNKLKDTDDFYYASYMKDTLDQVLNSQNTPQSAISEEDNCCKFCGIKPVEGKLKTGYCSPDCEVESETTNEVEKAKEELREEISRTQETIERIIKVGHWAPNVLIMRAEALLDALDKQAETNLTIESMLERINKLEKCLKK